MLKKLFLCISLLDSIGVSIFYFWFKIASREREKIFILSCLEKEENQRSMKEME